jgi:hypothetical protein
MSEDDKLTPLGAALDFGKLTSTSSPGIRDESLILSPMPTDPPAQLPRSASCGEESHPAPQALSREGLPPPEDIVGAAIGRLNAALEALDRAVSLHGERRSEQADQEAEYSALQEDRSRLAQALDAANGRVETLQDNQFEAARRVERASAAVRAILAAQSGDN